MAKNFTVSTTFKGIDQMSKTFTRINSVGSKVIGNLTSKFKGLTNSVNNFSKSGSVSALGFAGAIGGTVSLVAGIKSAITAGMDFEQAMTAATAKMGVDENTKQFKELAGVVKKVGAETKFTAVEAAQGLDFLATAGFSASQSMVSLPKIAKVAVASNMDIARTADILSDSLGSMGLGSKDASVQSKNLERLSNVLTKVTMSANTNLNDLFETIKYSGADAKQAGVKLEEYVAMLGLMANSGIKASMAGTATRSMFSRLQKPTKSAVFWLKKANVQVADSSGNMRTMVDILGQMQKGMKGFTGIERSKAFGAIFGATASTASKILFSNASKDILKYQKDLENSAGFYDKLADKMSNTTQGKMMKMLSALSSVGMAFYEQIRDPLKQVFDALAQVFGGIASFIRENKLVIDVLKNVVLGLGGVLLAVKSLTFGVRVLSVAWQVLNGAIKVSPVGWVITIITILITVITVLYDKFDLFRKLFDKVWGGIKTFLSKIPLIGGFFGKIFGKSGKLDVTHKLETPKTPDSVFKNNTAGVLPMFQPNQNLYGGYGKGKILTDQVMQKNYTEQNNTTQHKATLEIIDKENRTTLTNENKNDNIIKMFRTVG